MYGILEVDVLANKLLKTRLTEHDYFEVKHTPSLFKHETRPIWLTLTMDDLSVKYTEKEHAEYLMSVIGRNSLTIFQSEKTPHAHGHTGRQSVSCSANFYYKENSGEQINVAAQEQRALQWRPSNNSRRIPSLKK